MITLKLISENDDQQLPEKPPQIQSCINIYYNTIHGEIIRNYDPSIKGIFENVLELIF